ncbi:MAG: glycosyltransferase family 2 protein [Candidatus Hydrogenedentota bacterium]
MSDLCIIIVTYNGEKYIKNSIDSILKFVPVNKQIIIIDNSSSDKTVDILKQYKEIKLIKNRINRGFARAVNQGLNLYPESKWYLLLNQDTEFIKEGIEELIAEQEPVIIGCGLKRNKNDKLYKSYFSFPNITRIFYETSGLKIKMRETEIQNFEPRHSFVDYIEGSFFLMNREVIKRNGLFDEKYFFYHEELDYCYRAMKKGIKIFYNPGYSIVHYGGGSRTFLFPAVYFKNFGYFLKKHYSFPYRELCFIAGLSGLILRTFINLKWVKNNFSYLKDFIKGFYNVND